jgi:hypothetical protein
VNYKKKNKWYHHLGRFVLRILSDIGKFILGVLCLGLVVVTPLAIGKLLQLITGFEGKFGDIFAAGALALFVLFLLVGWFGKSWYETRYRE